MSKTNQSDHWIVRTNYQNRTASFLMLFAIVGAQMAGNDHGLVTWAGVVLLFLSYPHLAYWRARCAAAPYQAELHNLLIDSALLGACAAALGFPVWISFAMLVGTAITHVLYLGIAGVLHSLAAIALGMALTVMALGWRFAPETSAAATLMCIVGLTLYLLSLTNIAYLRTRKLQDSRQNLQRSEQALHQTNAALQTQLEQTRQLQSQLSDQANRDGLTGLYNRRYLDSSLQRELARCQRDGSTLSLVLVDIDFFKQVNDRHSHGAGDAVLQGMAALLTALTRVSDVACRFGGEEFFVLLPQMSPASAYAKAEQLRLAFAAETVLYEGAAIQCTLSAGVATFPADGQTPAALIRCADLALYQAKSEGRNRSVLYRPARPVQTGATGT